MKTEDKMMLYYFGTSVKEKSAKDLTPEKWIRNNYGKNWTDEFFDGWETSDVIKAMEGFHKEKLRGELLEYDEWYYSAPVTIVNLTAEQLVDKYLKSKQ